jgi:hypothetical protein
MNTVRVSVRLVDGGLLEFAKGPEFLRELQSLQSQGFVGRELVHHLLTDDWSAPPLSVEISWNGPSGNNHEILIPYT